MTTRTRNTKLKAMEAVAGDRDLMKALMKEALAEVLEGEMTRISGHGTGFWSIHNPRRLAFAQNSACP
jgi:hypothetical protein